MKIHSLIIFTVFCIGSSFFQNQLRAQVSDQKRIALTPLVPSDAKDLPPASQPLLLSRLRQLATSNGFAGSANYPQFILAANPVLVDKKIAGTAPVKILIELELSLYIADQVTKTIFSSTTVSVKGVGSSETEAYQTAFKALRLDQTAIKDFTNKGRDEIINFYNTHCEQLMTRVDLLVKTNQAEAGLELLLDVPDVSKSCAELASGKAAQVFEAAANQRCQALLQAAKAAWAAEPDVSGASKAASYLSVLPPGSKCQTESNTLLSEIKVKMKQDESWQREQYKDSVDLMRRYIQATRDIGVAYGNGQPDTQIIVKGGGWLW